MNIIILISSLLVLASFIITTFLEKQYSFVKLSAFMLFYYALIVIFSMIGQKILPKGGKLIGSVLGLLTSVLLWFKFGDYSKVKY
jgi:hypothetical protein